MPRAPKYAKVVTGKVRRPSAESNSSNDDSTMLAAASAAATAAAASSSSSSLGSSEGALRDENEEVEPTNSGDGGSGAKTKIKSRTIRVHCATSNKDYMRSMVEIFGGFGRVKTNVRDGPYIKIQLESTEKQALKAVSEVNKVKFKGEKVRAKFSDGSLEDSPAFRAKNPLYFKNYPKELIPTEQVQ